MLSFVFITLFVVVALLALYNALRDHFDTVGRSKRSNTFPFIALLCALAFGSFSLDLWKKDVQTQKSLLDSVVPRFDTLAERLDAGLNQYSEFGEKKHADQILAQEKGLIALNAGFKLLTKTIDAQSIALQELEKLRKHDADLRDTKYSRVEALVDSHLVADAHVVIPPKSKISAARLDDLVEIINKKDVWNKPRVDLQQSEILIEYEGKDYYLKHLFDTTAFTTKEPEAGCRCKEKSCIDLSFLHGVEVKNANSWIAKSRSTRDLISLVVVGRHDVRAYQSNSAVAQGRAECAGAFFNFSDIPIRYTSGVNRNNNLQLSEVELARDRQVEIYVIFQQGQKHKAVSNKDGKYEVSQQ